MDSFISHLEPVFRQFINLALLVIVMAFLVKPLLHYFAVNREIEHKKRLVKELQDSRGILDDDELGDDENETLSDQEKLQRMAAESPERAGNAVKKMLHDD
jgi:flagellar biosynthesis/type III secretory pathway M-ring protein FliF/YscJ